ncbi:hypothetical protein GH714_012959 [Hevea brasiliensis]|uniref:Disease resistance protein At4g27190-like leucine-rich repeats domain-containing protein n=1 Tax=Hevea brasiliensis TaxID=3981 RepID=A0A6A6N0W2_HEVBR|nr:hypothetical protein GH714_012959 [Hevea brasiliensis]
MASSNAGALSPPIFNGENYQIWAMRMKALLKGLDLWEAVDMGADPPPLRANPTVTQLKHYAEESAKKFKALSYIHSAMSESIFTCIMACETGKEAWDRLREEFQWSENTRQMQLLTSDKKGCIKMHDVARDVAKSMTSDVYFVKAGGEKFEWPKIENLKRYSAISIMENQIPEYPASWDCPNLQTLLLSDERSQLAMPEGVLKGMKTLKVLHLKRRSDAFLPGTQHLFISHNSTFGLKHSIRENSTFVHLTNLRTLILQYYGVGDISALGELKLLQILSFKSSFFLEPASAINRDSLAVLRSLNISFCSELEYLIDAEEWEIPPTTQQQQGTCLVCLETLSVSNLKALEALCKGELPYEISLSLTKLKLLSFNQCPKLSNVFASLNPQLQLKELEVLQVDYCDALEYIFEKKEDAPPCLRELKLDCLIGLKHIYKGSTELLDLCNLEFLEIKECNKLKVILPASAAQRLGKLKELHLHNCDQLEAVLAKRQEGEDTCENLVFSQLRVLSLVNLPNLTGFCTDYTLTFKWPSLEKVEVVRCPKMQMFAAVVASDGDSSTPKLKMIEVDGVDIMLDGTDINRVMQGRYKDKEYSAFQLTWVKQMVLNALESGGDGVALMGQFRLQQSSYPQLKHLILTELCIVLHRTDIINLAMEVLGSIFGEIGGYLVKAIKRRFGYCIHYHRNVETLKKQVQILEATRKDVEASTNTTKRNGEVIRNEVQNWTSTADGALSEATKFLQAVEEVVS